MRRAAVSTVLVILFSATAQSAASAAENEKGFVDRAFRDKDGDHKYVVFIPHDYTSKVKWPVILFLHGAGERGTDGQAPVKVGLGRAIRAREKDFKAIAVFPQCESRGPAARGWHAGSVDGKRALAILDQVEKDYSTDKDRVYLTGLSMGGFGTWSMAVADPKRWAAIVPICGGGSTESAEKIAQLPIWCFHGDADKAVAVELSRKMIQAIKKAGGNPKYTEYAGVGHNSWDAAYGDADLFTWLFSQRRSARF